MKEDELKKAKENFDKEIKSILDKKKENRQTSLYDFNPIYTPLDYSDEDYLDKLGFPGDYPFTRGVFNSMYLGKLWTMRQYAGFGTAKDSNERYRYLIEKGQTGLSVAFDLPTQMGIDSDDERAAGEVGKVGVAIDSLEDIEILFNGIPLDQVSTSMTINATAFILLSFYIALAEKQGIAKEKLSGTVQNDILKEYIARGTYIFPPEPSLRLITDVFEYCSKNVPKFNTISISGYHIREAGASAVQEVAFTFLNGLTYVKAAVEKGLDVNKFGERLSFFFNSHNNFFEEIAKFRAARRLWARLMKERFNVTNPRAMMLRFHTQTGGSTLLAQQVDVNIVRVTLQALAAVLGGTQSLHTNSRDEALGLPTEESATIALRTQQVIAYESGVADIIDPIGGSYAVESLTSKIEEEAIKLIEEVEMMGGVIKAIETNFIQRQIEESAYRYQKEIEEKKRIIVGLNAFKEEEKAKTPIMKVDFKIEEEQIRRLKRLKRERENRLVDRSLKDLKDVALSKDNIIPPTIEAVKNYATIGEITNTLKTVFGIYKSS